MKIPHYLVNTFLFFAPAIAQNIYIGIPKDGTVFSKGEKFTAQIIKPASIVGCIEVGIALSINSCGTGACPEPWNALGNVLYTGPWKPIPHGPGEQYENFTLSVPENINEGTAIFTVTNLCLIGGGPTPVLEFHNATVTIE